MNEIFYPFPKLEEVAPDILHCKFLTPAGVDLVMSCIGSVNKFTPNHRDKYYFTQDMDFNLDLPDLYELLKEHLEREIYPLAADFWWIGEFVVKNLFAVRYTMDTQTNLDLHHDASYITGSVKLNDSYKGAELYFPKKDFRNTDIAMGDLLLWPGDITHLHGCSELLEGEKYALTIWTTEI